MATKKDGGVPPWTGYPKKRKPRPKPSDFKVQFQLRWDAEMRDRVNEEKDRRGVSANWLINKILEDHLPDYESQTL